MLDLKNLWISFLGFVNDGHFGKLTRFCGQIRFYFYFFVKVLEIVDMSVRVYMVLKILLIGPKRGQISEAYSACCNLT